VYLPLYRRGRRCVRQRVSFEKGGCPIASQGVGVGDYSIHLARRLSYPPQTGQQWYWSSNDVSHARQRYGRPAGSPRWETVRAISITPIDDHTYANGIHCQKERGSFNSFYPLPSCGFRNRRRSRAPARWPLSHVRQPGVTVLSDSANSRAEPDPLGQTNVDIAWCVPPLAGHDFGSALWRAPGKVCAPPSCVWKSRRPKEARPTLSPFSPCR